MHVLHGFIWIMPDCLCYLVEPGDQLLVLHPQLFNLSLELVNRVLVNMIDFLLNQIDF